MGPAAQGGCASIPRIWRCAALAKQSGLFREVLEVIIPAVLIFLFVRTFLFEVRVVPSGSMIPAIMENDRFIAEKVTLRFREPRRGEILVFKPPAGAQFTTDYLKRVIGLPGETVEVRGGTVYINGSPLDEPYIPVMSRATSDFSAVQVPADSYFMMGDNRNASEDSRFWGFLPRRNIRGRAVLRIWPLNRFGSF